MKNLLFEALTTTCPDLWDLVDDDTFWQNRAERIARHLQQKIPKLEDALLDNVLNAWKQL